MNAVRSSGSRHAVNTSSNWSTTSRAPGSTPASAAARSACGPERRPQRCQRVRAGAEHHSRPALAARQHAGGERGDQPRADRGLPAADGPTTPSSVVLGTRATISATRRSRRRSTPRRRRRRIAAPCTGSRIADAAAPPAQRAQVDDVAGELVLQRAQLRAPLRRASRARRPARRSRGRPTPRRGRRARTPGPGAGSPPAAGAARVRSRPSFSTSVQRASWKASSASACRPER